MYSMPVVSSAMELLKNLVDVPKGLIKGSD
jgi:hypothetical protein